MPSAVSNRVRRMICLAVALCLCLSALPFCAADSIERQSDAVRTLQAFFQRLYPIGSGFSSENTPEGEMIGSAGFAELIYYRLFHESVGNSDRLSECEGLTLLESFAAGETARTDALKTTLGALRFGDFLQFDENGGVSFLLGSQGGDLVAYDSGYYSGTTVNLHFITYEDLLEQLNGHALYFYRPVSAPSFTEVTLSIVSKPSSGTCFLGAAPSMDGILLNYYSAQTGNVSVNAQSAGFSFFCNTRSAGIVPVILFHGVAFTFTRIEVSAEALSALIVKRPPSRGEYYVGEAINMSGAEIVAKLKDGTERILTESDYALEYDFSEVGVATVRVSYGGLSANFAVSVSNPPAVSMSVLPPSKTVYYAGEELDLTGGALLLNFETRSNVSVPLQKEMLAPYDTSRPGTVTITVRYESLSADFTVEVLQNDVTGVKPLYDFSTDAATGKAREYRIGSHLSPDTIEVEITYANGLTRTIPASQCVVTINGEETLEFKRAGEADIVFTYDGVSSGVSAVLVKKGAVDELVDTLLFIGVLVLGIPLVVVLAVILIRRAKAKRDLKKAETSEQEPEPPPARNANDPTIELSGLNLPPTGEIKDLTQNTIRLPNLDQAAQPTETNDRNHEE